MKTLEAVTWWVVLQLALLGMAEIAVHNELSSRSYNCGAHATYLPPVIGFILPLIVIIPSPTDEQVVIYCKDPLAAK